MRPQANSTSRAAAADGDDDLSTTAAAILDRLSTREETNKAEWAKRREEAQDNAAPEENIDIFMDHVGQVSDRVSSQLLALQAGGDKGLLQSQLDEIGVEIQKLDTKIAECSYFLPSYELRSATATASELRTKLESCKLAAAPKRKFAFSKKVNRVKAEDLVTRGADTANATLPQDTNAPTTSGSTEATEVTFARDVPRGPLTASRTVRLTIAELKAKEYVIKHMEDVIIIICDSSPLPMLRLQYLRNCRVQAGPITGAAFLDGMQCCVVMLAAYQVRIHTSTNCDFYLRTRSRPIIEHSTTLCFAPFIPLEPEVTQQFESAQLAESSAELWKDVDDFGWIKAVQSPNWAVLPEAERKPALAMLAAMHEEMEEI